MADEPDGDAEDDLDRRDRETPTEDDGSATAPDAPSSDDSARTDSDADEPDPDDADSADEPDAENGSDRERDDPEETSRVADAGDEDGPEDADPENDEAENDEGDEGSDGDEGPGDDGSDSDVRRGPVEPEQMSIDDLGPRGGTGKTDPSAARDGRLLRPKPDPENDESEDEAADGEIDDDETAPEDGSGDADSENDEAENDEAENDEGSDDESDWEDADEADADDSHGGVPERPRAQTDGEGYVGDRPASDEPPYPDPDDDVGGISTPPDDEEMPLADHIEEMILRLAVVLLVGSAGTAIGILWASEAISIIWTDVFPGAAAEVPPPHVYHPLELWLTRIKVAALLGILVALPVFVYQCYLFMRPGLYPHERKYYLAAVPTSLVLAVIGMVFSYFLVLPVLFRYFTLYSDQSADIAYALGETFNLVITVTGLLAIVFQIPLFIMLAIMMGVTTRRWLASKRLYFWAAFAVLAFTFTLDPTLMAAILVAITMIGLFEGTLALLKWAGRE